MKSEQEVRQMIEAIRDFRVALAFLRAVLAIRQMRIRRPDHGAAAVRDFLVANFGLYISRRSSMALWSAYGPLAMTVRSLERAIERARR